MLLLSGAGVVHADEPTPTAAATSPSPATAVPPRSAAEDLVLRLDMTRWQTEAIALRERLHLEKDGWAARFATLRLGGSDSTGAGDDADDEASNDDAAAMAALSPAGVTWHGHFRRSLAHTFPDEVAKSLAIYGVTIHRPANVDATTPLPAQVVVLVHGYDEAGKLWRSLLPSLTEAGVTVAEFTYPNDQAIPLSTAMLYHELATLRAQGVTGVTIVAHSMGGLVSRDLLTDPAYYHGSGLGDEIHPAVVRLITVGTPNHGSKLAVPTRGASEMREQASRMLRGDATLFGGIYDGDGQAAHDLEPDSAFLARLNARPLPQDVAITVIAGRMSPIAGNRFDQVTLAVPGYENMVSTAAAAGLHRATANLVDDLGDGCVSLSSSRLDGVSDYVLLEGNHLSLLRNVRQDSTRLPPALPVIFDRLDLDPSRLTGGTLAAVAAPAPDAPPR